MRIQSINNTPQFQAMRINDVKAWDKNVLSYVTNNKEICRVAQELDLRGQDLSVTYMFNKINGVWKNTINFEANGKLKILEIKNFFSAAADEIKALKHDDFLELLKLN